MADPHGPPTDPLTELRRRPDRFDLFHALRHVDAAHPELPPVGKAAGPHDEAVRVGSDAGMAFSAAEVGGRAVDEDGRLRVDARGFGLLGPNGPLPLHVTERIRSALLHDGDPAPLAFVELLQHRLLTLFHRAHAAPRATHHADRPESDRFSLYLGALFGLHDGARDRTSLPDSSRTYFAGRLGASTRSAEALEAIVRHEFGVPVVVTPFALGWLKLELEERTLLGRPGDSSRLGVGTVAGGRVRDRQSHLHLRLGPMGRETFAQLLPRGDLWSRLGDFVREFTRGELFCRVQLVLRRSDVPRVELGARGRLGRTSWLGAPSGETDAADAEFTLC